MRSDIHLYLDMGRAIADGYQNDCIVMYEILEGTPGVHSTKSGHGIDVRSLSQLRPLFVIHFKRDEFRPQPILPPQPPPENKISDDEAWGMHEAAKTLMKIRNRS